MLSRTIGTFLAGSVGVACAAAFFLASIASAQIFAEPTPLPEGVVATGDTTEVRALIAWAQEHLNSHSQQARVIAERALALARDLNDQRGIGGSTMLLGILTLDADQQEAYYTAAERAYEQIGHERNLVRSRLNLGMVYRRRGELERALTFFFDALKGLESLRDVEGQVVVLNNIGDVHHEQGNLEEALSYQERALALIETLDNPAMHAFMLNNMGVYLSEHGSYERAEATLHQALSISAIHGTPYQTALIFNNLGSVLNGQGRYELALSHLHVAESLTRELEEDYQLLIAVYKEMGKAHLGLGQFDHALHYANESLVLAREGEMPSRQMEAHQTLWQIYKAAGNYEQALVHYEEYVAGRDSVFTAERADIIRDMQTHYETEEHRRTIERLEQEGQIQALQTSRWRMGMFAGVGGLLLLLGFLYYHYRTKQKANRLLEELDAAKSRFFANISHEFRTPLTVILGGLQDGLAGRFGMLSEGIINRDQALLRNTRRLERLINEVLDLNRLEAGHLELRLTPGDLVQSLKYIVETNAPLAERNGITLSLACDLESCPRLYDEEKLEKIAGNLLSNALKFTPQGCSVRVHLRCEDHIEISVTDDGPGIPVEAQATVFERFVQLDHGVLHGGTGIGLALAKELTELHGGTITLESTLGKGSTFTVRLPLERATLTVSEGQKTKCLPDADTFEAGGDGHAKIPLAQFEESPEDESDRTTILIIEDDDDVRAYVRRSLEETYGVIEAVNGEAGLQQARSALPDLIVSDVMLPDIDGFEIARRLKATNDTECIPVVMLTARAAQQDHAAGYDSGAETYITKPFSPETLRAAIARLLEERRRLRRQVQAEVKQLELTSQNNHPTLSDNARAVILERLQDENFGVDELAAALDMSYRTLHRHLESEVGLSPGDFLRTLRLERAHTLLTSGAGSVSEVAYAVGFKSLSHFTRRFREQYGELPSSVKKV